jgi:hypothetical protein
LETSTREEFIVRCQRVADAAHAAGLTLSKLPHAFAVVVARDGKSIPFPIPSDERDWLETTAEEAFYCAVTDAFAWASARPGETSFATLDAIERSEVPQIQRDLEDQLKRVRELAVLVGGMDGMRRLWEAAGIDANVAAGIDLR